MRKLTAGFFHSVDGVVSDPFLWQFDAFDDELGALLSKTTAAVDTILLGRVGYQEWSGYWPTAEADLDFKTFINDTPKFVASRTLTQKDLTWKNSTLIDGDVERFVRNLKTQKGGEIAVMGGVSLAKQLLFAGLLDSLTLITHPVVAGAGKHFFEPTDPVTRLELQDSVRTSKGNAVLTYGLRK
jgi:dihydrofolate reductase